MKTEARLRFETGTATEVQEVMSTGVITALDSETVGEAVARMQAENISALPVINAEGSLVGIVSVDDLMQIVSETENTLERNFPHYDDCLWFVDLIRRRMGSDLLRTVMSEVVTTVRPDLMMHHAACIMINNRVHHLPVVDAKGRIVGMLSSSDFVRLVAGIDPRTT